MLVAAGRECSKWDERVDMKGVRVCYELSDDVRFATSRLIVLRERNHNNCTTMLLWQGRSTGLCYANCRLRPAAPAGSKLHPESAA